MSALTPKADIADRNEDVRFVPKAGIPDPSGLCALLAAHGGERDTCDWRWVPLANERL